MMTTVNNLDLLAAEHADALGEHRGFVVIVNPSGKEAHLGAHGLSRQDVSAVLRWLADRMDDPRSIVVAANSGDAS